MSGETVVPVVLLAGGLGTRLREETEFRPKPMVEIGGHPILWHIMKLYSSHGHAEFVVCTGYKSEIIKDYFLNYEARNNDVTVRLGDTSKVLVHGSHDEADWTVTVANTGALTNTGGRISRVQKYVRNRTFMATYGDGLADVDISALLAFHKSHGRLATVTAVRPLSRFGVLEVDDGGAVRHFREKPQTDGWVNVGYFVFEPDVFDYLDDECTLEQEPLANLASDGQLIAYRHDGFWQPMDTYREATLLNDMWSANEAPWRVWQ